MGPAGGWRLFGSLCLLLATVLARPVAAHPVPFSYLDLHCSDRSLHAALVVHVYDVAHELGVPPERLLEPAFVAERSAAIVALFSSRIQLAVDGGNVPLEWSRPEVVSERQALRFEFERDSVRPLATVYVNAALFPYDANHQTFVNLYEGELLVQQRILDREHPEFWHFSGTGQGRLRLLERFLRSGVQHILGGPDHILFLLALLLPGGALRQLLLIVTAFSLAHSVTLSLAVLNLFAPPSSLIEPAIALSIVYTGADNLLSRGRRDVRVWIALGFGLIHGFGFAGVLREMGLPASGLGWALFSFNAGVELGQLLVVVVAASALGLLRRKHARASGRLLWVGSVLVMGVGVFWFVQRAFFAGSI
jgi:HupE/UreJ protein